MLGKKYLIDESIVKVVGLDLDDNDLLCVDANSKLDETHSEYSFFNVYNNKKNYNIIFAIDSVKFELNEWDWHYGSHLVPYVKKYPKTKLFKKLYPQGKSVKGFWEVEQ
jgi:hypothetical protein